MRNCKSFVHALLAGSSAWAQTKIHWYGQAALKMETPTGGVILVDPWLKVPTKPKNEGEAAALASGNPAQFKEAPDARGLGGRMVEMKPEETRGF